MEPAASAAGFAFPACASGNSDEQFRNDRESACAAVLPPAAKADHERNPVIAALEAVLNPDSNTTGGASSHGSM